MVGFCSKSEEIEEWIKTLLKKKFFNPCCEHPGWKKNEFCINCRKSLCQQCLCSTKSHTHHKILQIRKYVYHDVVRIKDMNVYFNCFKIQTYKNNGSRVVFLNPREVIKPLKTNGDASCERCERSLTEPQNCYCSIACKLAMRTNSGKGLFPVQNQELCGLSPDANEDSGSDIKEDDSSESLHVQTEWKEGSPFQRHCLNDSPSFRLKHHFLKRKGFPRRAPFF